MRPLRGVQPIDRVMPASSARVLAIAERDPRRGLVLADRMRTRADPADSSGQAWAAYVAGWARIIAEQARPAEAMIEDALARFQALGIAEPQPLCRFALAITSFFLRLDAELIDKLQGVIDELRATGARHEARLAATYLAAVYNILGRPGEAAALLDETERELTDDDLAVRGRLLRVRAVAAANRGEPALAHQLFAAAEQIFLALQLRIDLAKSWYERAAALMRQELFEPALHLQAGAERVFRQSALPFRCALCAKDRGFAQLRLGRFDQAVPNLLRALVYFRTLGRTRDVAHCLLQLGNVLLSAGSWQAALTCYARAEALGRALGMAGEIVLHALINRARVYRAQHQPHVALALQAEAERLAEQLGDAWLLAEATHLAAALSADLGWHDQALQTYQLALSQYRQLGTLPGAAACQLDLAELLLIRGELPAAESALLEAAGLHGGQAELIWRCDYGLARCAELAGAHDSALAHYQRACAQLADLRWRLAGSEHSSQLYAAAARMHSQALQLALRMGLAEAALALAEEQRALALQHALMLQRLQSVAASELFSALLSRIEQAEQQAHDSDAQTGLTQLELLEADALALAAELRFQLAQLREQLELSDGTGWIALAYTQMGEQLATFVITSDAVTVELQPYAPQLRRLIERATAPAYRRYSYQAAPWDALDQLGQRLIPAEARARLRADAPLLIVPCGPLHALPWPALRIDGAWLVERAIVQVLPALRMLQPRPAAQPGNRQALLLGCADFGERAPALPGVGEELATIAATLQTGWRTTQVPAATAAELQLALERDRYALLHIASHAQLRASEHHAAHIAFSDADLTIDSIARLSLAGATVVLSVCEGAAPASLPGDEVVSLGWALLAAGAGAVIASIWPIYDRAAVQLMRQLYLQIDAGHAPAAALTLAQRAVLQEHADERSPLAQPLIWACFVCIGANPGW